MWRETSLVLFLRCLNEYVLLENHNKFVQVGPLVCEMRAGFVSDYGQKPWTHENCVNSSRQIFSASSCQRPGITDFGSRIFPPEKETIPCLGRKYPLCICLLLNIYCLVWLLELELGAETVNKIILALEWSTVLQISQLIHYCCLLAGAPVTTTTAAVVSQSPQLYNQQTNSPDSPVITALITPRFQCQGYVGYLA